MSSSQRASKITGDALAIRMALARVPGIGYHRFEQLMARFGSAENVLGASIRELAEVPGVGPVLARSIAGADVDGARRVIGKVEDLGGAVLVPEDERYPPLLAEIPDPPLILFALGRVELLRQPAVAIVGSRSHTRYGAEVCRHFAAGLVRHGLVVVSGMARGLDAVAHAAALDAKGGTIGVLANGFGVVYPASNRALYDRVAQHGCLITEQEPGERPFEGSFPKRNRLISGLARVTLVVEAHSKSGALITAGRALQQGRDLLAVPGPITSEASAGCNRLIQQGAKPALGLRDVLEEYGIALRGVPSVHLPGDLTEWERRVLALLNDGSAHADDLAARLGWGAAETLATLTSLEIRGLVSQEGKIFRKRPPESLLELTR
jgi:DNA processing protein